MENTSKNSNKLLENQIKINFSPNNSDDSTINPSSLPFSKSDSDDSDDDDYLPPRKFQFVTHSKFITLAHSNGIHHPSSYEKSDENHGSNHEEKTPLLDDSLYHRSKSRYSINKFLFSGIKKRNNPAIPFKNRMKLFILASLFFLVEYGIILMSKISK